MNVPTDSVPSSAAPAFEPAPPPAVRPSSQDGPAADPAREINARRAQLENPELLRRLRSL